MALDINLYGKPPSFVDCESFSRRHSQSIGAYAFVFVLLLLLAHMAYSKNQLLTIVGAAGAIFSLYRLVTLCLQMRHFEYVPQHIMDDFTSAGLPLITAYCEAVKKLGRSLIWAEVNAFLEQCRNDPAAYEKVKEHEKKHFLASFLDHMFSW